MTGHCVVRCPVVVGSRLFEVPLPGSVLYVNVHRIIGE